jgi:hypothetical protein
MELVNEGLQWVREQRRRVCSHAGACSGAGQTDMSWLGHARETHEPASRE